ncbi:MAG: hypothetical protein QXP38_05805 [Nitrososphaerota archaeon]
MREIEQKLWQILNNPKDEPAERWEKFFATILDFFPQSTRYWISQGMDTYAELIIKDTDIFLLEVDDYNKVKITKIDDSNPLYYYVLYGLEWTRIEE